VQRELGIRFPVGPIHGLKEEMPEREGFKIPGIGARLRINKLQFVAASLLELCACLGAYADPIQTRRSGNRSIGFYGYFKVAGVEGIDQGRIHLQQWLAAGADYKSLARIGVLRPLLVDGARQGIGRREPSAARSIDTYKLGVAELADRGGAIGFAARPEIATRKTAEDRGTAGLRAFALQGVEDFFYCVGHKSSFQHSALSSQLTALRAP